MKLLPGLLKLNIYAHQIEVVGMNVGVVRRAALARLALAKSCLIF